MGLAQGANLGEMSDMMAKSPWSQRTKTKAGLRMPTLFFLEEMADINGVVRWFSGSMKEIERCECHTDPIHVYEVLQ